jgi:hypothetical protein
VVVQLVRIPACHAGGREFESRPLRQLIKKPESLIQVFLCLKFRHSETQIVRSGSSVG